MGRLSGFRYRDIVRRLQARGFVFDRQAAGSHEIWFNAATNHYTTIPNHPGDTPEGTLGSSDFARHPGIAQRYPGSSVFLNQYDIRKTPDSRLRGNDKRQD